jgi:hypothetical protein
LETRWISIDDGGGAPLSRLELPPQPRVTGGVGQLVETERRKDAGGRAVEEEECRLLRRKKTREEEGVTQSRYRATRWGPYLISFAIQRLIDTTYYNE